MAEANTKTFELGEEDYGRAIKWLRENYDSYNGLGYSIYTTTSGNGKEIAVMYHLCKELTFLNEGPIPKSLEEIIGEKKNG